MHTQILAGHGDVWVLTGNVRIAIDVIDDKRTYNDVIDDKRTYNDVIDDKRTYNDVIDDKRTYELILVTLTFSLLLKFVHQYSSVFI